MNQTQLKQNLGQVDIYLLDQLMKQRYAETDLILDAGCGFGRNFSFMCSLGFNISACDTNEDAIIRLKQAYPTKSIHISDLSNLFYNSNNFDHIICNAVLHFAKDEVEFKKMIVELHRVLKPNGTLFIRMTSEFGIEALITPKDGQFQLPDGSSRFLLNTQLIDYLQTLFTFIEPLKTVNVNNLRCMSTLRIKKRI